VRKTKWSSFLGRATHKDSNKVKFVFFLMFLQFYMNFGGLNQFLEYLN
jgi:hypothetical protein